jgi:RND family efflux transporter MFP subunit
VTATDAEAGQVLAAGQTVVRIARAGEMEVVVDVAESQSIKVGQPASVTLWAVPGRTFKGRVRELAPAADAVTRTYRSRIQLQDSDEAIRLGMSATVNLVPEAEKMTGVVLPLSAVYGADKSARVWVLDKDARARAREVRVLATTTRGLKVAGLAHGEIVVTAGAHLLQEGQKVRPMTTVESR